MKHAVLLFVPLAACGADVPDKPTYFADVQPILRANCVRCHGADPTDPKIAKFRLDRYVKDDALTFDAWDYAQGDPAPIVRVAVDHEAPAMPPDYSLSDRQREILARWIEQGAPKGMRANHTPQIELVSPTETTTADQALDTTFRTWDEDLDGLYVQLWAHDVTDPSAENDWSMGPTVGGGQRQIAIDTGTLASNRTFEIYAVLDDGYQDDPAMNRVTVTLIPSLLVDHGVRGTAPRVALLSPNGGETLIDTAVINWTASDPDPGDSLTFAIDLMRVNIDGTTTVAAPIASGIGALTFAWKIPMTIQATDGAGNSIPYKIRVTATDTLGQPPNVRSDDSDLPVFIGQATTTTSTWADVRPLFDKYCKACHAGAAKTPAIDYFCMLKYNTADPDPACETNDEGVFDVKGIVYQRMVGMKSMPPATEPKPTQAELDKVGNWILGGAPMGGGPADALPTLTWIAPGATVLDGRTTGTATLSWTDADAEGLASDRIEYAKVTGTNFMSTCTATMCPPAMGTWKPLTMNTVSGTSQMQTFSWSTPTGMGEGQGCYCVRGTVIDSAMQSATANASKPVKF